MSYPIFVVDAFTSQPFGGNPAAVVLGRGDSKRSGCSWLPRR